MAEDAFAADLIDTPPITVRPDPNNPNRGITDKLPTRTEPVGEGGGVSADAAMAELERRAQDGGLSPRAQEALTELKRRKGIVTDSPATENAPQDDSALRPVGVAATGFNKGLAGWVDLVNQGLKGLGLPMSDEPFMGSAFVDKYLGGAQLQPQNLMESVLQRAGLEVGANAPLLGAGGAIGAAGAATKTAGAERTLTATSQRDAITNLPEAITQQLAEVSPSKLAAVESALAAGAGTGAEIVSEVFPEGGATAEFVGEILGGFAPTVALGMVRRAGELAHSAGRVVLGTETEAETKRRLGGTLKDAATPEQVQEGVARADDLRQAVSPDAPKGEGLELSTGSALSKAGVVTATEKAESKSSVKLGAALETQHRRNIETIQNFFNETAPEGDPIKVVERLQQERSKNEALLQVGLDRTEMRVAAARGELSTRQTALLSDLETRMQAADQALDDRLRVIGPSLRPQQRKDVIRQAYNEEVGKFRERSRADYHELDNLGHAELPIAGTVTKLADLEAQFPGQLQAITKINPRVGRVITTLGHDYELIQRAEKAQADLQAVGGKGTDQRGGFSFGVEQDGTGSTQQSVGVPSNYPDWYKSLANEKIAGTENVLDRETIEKALDTLKTGTKHGLHDGTLEFVKRAIMQDREFKKSPWFEPVMDELNNAPSASLKDLRQLRSDLLAMSRQARAGGDRVQGYVLNELTGAVDRDIDNLLPGTSAYAEFYPDHGTLYRQISADYREGVATLFRGQTGKLRAVGADGSYRVEEKSVPALFWKDETSLDQFLKAFGSQPDAKLALRDFALEDLYQSVVKPIELGKYQVDEKALQNWLDVHGDKLKAFPDLEPMFRDAAALQKNFDVLEQQMTQWTAGQKGTQRINQALVKEMRPGDFHPGDVARAEAKLAQVESIVTRSKHDWERSKAALFLRQDPRVAANGIVTDKEPMKAYAQVVKQLKGDEEAIAGLNTSIWYSITDKMAPRLIGVGGDVNLGVLQKTLQDMQTVHGDLMKTVLGPDGYKRIEVATEVIQKIATGAKKNSDTAINLQVHAALASTWLSRGWAALSGRVPMGFGMAERGMQYLIKTMERMTAEQQEGILLEAFTNPKAFQALVNAATYGPDAEIVKKQLAFHLHALNLSEQMPKESK